MKFSSLTVANLANPANPLPAEDPAPPLETINFKDDTVANLANPANRDAEISNFSDFSNADTRENAVSGDAEISNFSDFSNADTRENAVSGDAEISNFSDFSNADTRENANFSAVRCADCRHGKPATANDPYSWHSCRSGNPGWWGMAPQRCEGWERKP